MGGVSGFGEGGLGGVSGFGEGGLGGVLVLGFGGDRCGDERRGGERFVEKYGSSLKVFGIDCAFPDGEVLYVRGGDRGRVKSGGGG